MKDKFLLHICCATCAIEAIDQLQDKYEIVGYYYNPNIQPLAEYEKRENDVIRYLEMKNIQLIPSVYDYQSWFELTKGYEQEKEGGKRCTICYRMRLENAGEKAKELKIKNFGTTLTISPHKKASIVNKVGKDIADKYSISFFKADFKKGDGFKRAIAKSKQENFYRQNYCGCLFSRSQKK